MQPWRNPIFAVIRTGGKQYRVDADQTFDVARLTAEAGSMVEFSDVLLLDDAGEVELGTPFVEGARVVAEVIEHGRDPKILVFKYKNKTRYRRRKGHRQAYTRVAVREILTDGRREAEKPASRPRRRKAVEKTVEAPVGPARKSEGVRSPAATKATIDNTRAAAPRPARARKAPQLSTETAGEAPRPEDAKTARRPRTKKS